MCEALHLNRQNLFRVQIIRGVIHIEARGLVPPWSVPTANPPLEN